MKVNTKLAVILICILALAVGTFAGCGDNTTQEHTITFDYQGATSGFAESTRKVTQDTAIGTLPSPAKVGFTFNGWFTQPDGQGTHILPENNTFDNDITLYAHFVQSAYRVVFIDYDGTVLKEEYIEEGGSATAPAVLINARLGYTFDGWDKPYSEITSNLTLTAQYTINLYIITLIGDPAAGGSVSGDGTYEYGSDVTVTASTNIDYIFDGWYNSAGTKVSGNASYSFAAVENVTLTAKWSENAAYTSLEEMLEQNGAILQEILQASSLDMGELTFYTADKLPEIPQYQFPFELKLISMLVVEEYRLLGETLPLAIELGDEQSAAAMLEFMDSSSAYELTSTLYRIGNFIFIDMLGAGEVLTGNAYRADDNNYYSTDDKKLLLYNNKAEHFALKEGIEQIKPCALAINNSLTHIEMPSTLKTIGHLAFALCEKLENVIFDENSQLESIGDDAFYYCNSLESVTFGENSKLTSIGKNAFRDCNSLTSIEIPSSVTSIGEHAFLWSYRLTGVHISDIAAWCKISFYNFFSNPLNYAKKLYLNGVLVTELTIPDSVTSIGDYAFSYCNSFTSVTFGENSQLTHIGNSAFQGCSSLTSIEIPSSVTSIGYEAFYNCYSLTSINVSADNNNYTSQNDVLFNKNITALIAYPAGKTETEYTVPSSVTSIVDNAFSYCNSLTSVEIPSSVTSIGNGAFFDCDNLTSVTFGENIKLTSIGEDAFFWCGSLTSIEIPANVTSIGYSAFSYCRSLESVTFGENSELTSIDERAFLGCGSLTSIEIPASVMSIGDYAFSDCSRLTSVTVFAETPPQAGYYLFGLNPNPSLDIYVPAASVDAYKSASGWSKYASIIYPMP